MVVLLFEQMVGRKEYYGFSGEKIHLF